MICAAYPGQSVYGENQPNTEEANLVLQPIKQDLVTSDVEG